MKNWLDSSENFVSIPHSKKGDIQLYQHLTTGTILQSKTVKLHSRSYETFKNITEWRYKTRFPISKIFYVQLIKQIRQGCYIKFFEEKCQQLLPNIYNLTFEQAVYILKHSLIGIEQIIKKFGYFFLTSKMIGITCKGQCKIVINQQLQQNFLNKNKLNSMTLITKLLNIIQQHTYQTTLTKNFFQKAVDFTERFSQILDFIDKFCKKNGIIISQNFERQELKGSLLTKQSTVLSKKCLQLKQIIKQSFQMNLSFLNSRKKTSKYSKNKTFAIKSIKSQNDLSLTNKNSSQKTDFSSILNYSLVKDQTCSSNAKSMDIFTKFKQNEQYTPQPISPFAKQNFKMSIISAVSMNISPLRQYTTCESLDHKIQNFERLVHENFQNQIWKKTISKLFSSENNLKESLSYGQQQKVYLKDFNLAKLGQFGRFITTSLLQQDQDQYSSIIQE